MRAFRIPVVLAVGAALVVTAGVAPGVLPRLAATASSVHFSASGDFGTSASAQAVFTGIGAAHPDLHLALGDLSYSPTGQEQAWCDLVTQGVGAGFPFELVSGNHESNGQNGNINDFSACLPNQLPGAVGTYGRQYYVDVPQGAPLVRFVMISPALPFADGTWSYAAGSARYNWTSAAIDGAHAAGIPWVVVGMHKPCLSLGQYTCEPGADLLNLLVDKRVDLVLSGHEHLYQRTHQLATGAGCSAIAPGTFTAACVVDSDAAMRKGAGTVFATVGTGGNGNYNVNTADTEARYFGASGGSSASPIYGSLDVTASASELTASFNRVAGAAFADSFTLGAGGGNVPPSASFATTCTDLTCAFDGTGSTDPDGTITSYAWEYGDGATGSGATASHPYASAGTYTARLTVTDNGGATAVTTRQVTVTAPPQPGVLASDPFERTVANGWGTAPTGGAWTFTGSASRYAVNGTAATMQLPTASGGTTYLTSVSSAATDLRLSVAIDKLPSSGSVYLSVSGRRITTAGAYQSKVIISSAGKVSLYIVRVNSTGGAEVVVQNGVAVPGTYAAGTKLSIRVKVTGTNPTLIESRVWPGGSPEPTAWQRSITDSTPELQGPGGLGLTGYLSGGVANSPVTLTVDDLTATAP
ncbi:PKD domain-containing protein [Leifsonia sp. NPDC058292]|uniref:PKD domain-containing protein n=1 Tax=Leifsonia sp. NPDC058292 TaxID=3346428 RepID=UPI0036DEAEFA